MAQHQLAFTIITDGSDSKNVKLSTHRRYYDEGENWVETVNGRVRQSDIDKATKPLSSRNRYGEDIADELSGDEDFRQFVEAKRRERIKDNPAATEKEATITLPVKDAVGFKVGRWYKIRFEELEQEMPVRDLIQQEQGEKVAVRRQEQATREQQA